MTMHHTRRSFASASLAVFASLAAGQAPVIDGHFDDWTDEHLVATDPAGDSESGRFDVTRVWARALGSHVYVSVEFADENPDNLQAALETGGDTAWLQLTLPETGASLSIAHAERIAFVASHREAVLPWNDLDYAVLPTVAATRYEARVDLGKLGLAEGKQLTIDVSPGNARLIPAGPRVGDALPEPVTLTAGSAEPGVVTPDLSKLAGAMRLANMNTLRDGLIDTKRRETIGRMLRAVAPDIVTLQEEYDMSPGDLAKTLTAIDPLGDGARWNVHKDARDCVIASTRPITPIPSEPNAEFSAAIVGKKPSEAVLVLSVHTPCCGYAGSERDVERVQASRAMADLIDALRAGSLGPQFEAFASAGVLITGDWNLVGSIEPLSLLTESEAGPDLEHLTLLSVDGRDASTWRELDGLGFSPGLLDLVVFDPRGLRPLGGFVLDTERMDRDALKATGLKKDDSRVSDHLMLIADFAPAGEN